MKQNKVNPLMQCYNVEKMKEDNGMDKKNLEYQIRELKLDYVRLQNDLEKLDSVNGNIAPLERQIAEIEKEISTLSRKLREM